MHLGDTKTVFSKREIDVVDPASLVGSNIEEDIISEIQAIKDQRQKDILMSRFGFPKFLTLEELGQNYQITRERIRQIEAKGLDYIFRDQNNKLCAWYQILREMCLQSKFPIDIHSAEIIDHRLKAENSNLERLINTIIYWSDRKGKLDHKNILALVNLNSNIYLSHIIQNDVLTIQNVVEENLLSVDRENLLYVKKRILSYFPESQLGFFNLIWDEELKNCLILSRADGNDLLIKYIKKSAIERTVQLIIEEVNSSDRPLRRENFKHIIEQNKLSLTSISNALQSNEDIFPIRHGLWATFKHLEFTDNDRKVILNEAMRKIEAEPNRQFHSREIEEKINNELSTDLNYFAVAAIIRKFGDFKYLGRNVFASPEAEIDQRYYINEAVVNVLRSNNRVMHLTDIFEEAKELVSISSSEAINIVPPLVNLGGWMIGLDYWDNE